MKISSKLSIFFLCMVVIFVGLAMTLLGELRSISARYDSLLQGPVQQAEAARRIQVDFKKQVQEWKDILLRGHTPADLTKYTQQFHEREAAVKDAVVVLATTVEDPETRQVLNDFRAAHETLSAKYQASYATFVSTDFDFKAADKMVRGQDRVPTDLFDKAVAQLNARVTSLVAKQKADVARQRNIALFLAVGLLGLVSLGGFIVVRGILSRLGKLKAVSDRLAVADVTGLVIDISGRDEVGEFGESMKGVAAAIEELSTLAGVQAA
jgi:methyl-accepting chemotaxis protein